MPFTTAMQCIKADLARWEFKEEENLVHKKWWLSFAVVALLFAFHFAFVAVCRLLIAVPSAAADTKVPDKPQPFLNNF